MTMQHRVVFLSPAGTTRLVAQTIVSRLELQGGQAKLIDLADLNNSEKLANCYAGWPDQCCLWLGSPVYCDHALPVVEEFVRNLPGRCSGYSVPFATWGGVTSGLALPELAAVLLQKNFSPLGAAKILAVHSTSWNAAEPLGAGHPTQNELQMIYALVDTVTDKIKDGPARPLELSLLNYLPETMRTASASKSLAMVKAALPPLEINPSACTQCGTCASECPMSCIELKPYPDIGAGCIRCLQCVKTCPEAAFLFDPAPLVGRIRSMAGASAESKQTQIFS